MSILKIKNEQGVYEDILTVRGKSAYQSYLDTTDDVPVLTEAEWSANMDTSNYATKVYVDDELTKKVNKIAGKGLSTNDYTNEDKTKVDAIPADAKYTDTTYTTVTQTTNGLMSSADKSKLDDIKIVFVTTLPASPDPDTYYFIAETI